MCKPIISTLLQSIQGHNRHDKIKGVDRLRRQSTKQSFDVSFLRYKNALLSEVILAVVGLRCNRGQHPTKLRERT